ncbi:hypothetical protein L1F06_000660 [Ectopseudomonas hydrolytica]|uniref:Uncharacterized protein n=1 Tax=Ectopseudomonas hydrolytica TaxID=2493633 RepID=A0ABY5A8M9_9GAMM|nr:hypothetical protein [Pseudomonas hydrolytica]USR39980.1 hypothetical protein L1F06_000660 [Pseudomonas hydrolytica]
MGFFLGLLGVDFEFGLYRLTDWSPEHYAWLSQHHPAGIQEEALDSVEASLRAAFTRRPTLSVVGGA